MKHYNGPTYSHKCGGCKNTWLSRGAATKQMECPGCGKKNCVTRTRVISADKYAIGAVV